ncbi:MAG: class I SAM-dependent methyltransferase [Actinobacteria bacterium]|nr:class I SAM-dependent methyltransferase [Actinomycetota bacterium]MBM3713743.1 class I SAM-dependent methyltransferase [Actinomycetota bacterium]
MNVEKIENIYKTNPFFENEAWKKVKEKEVEKLLKNSLSTKNVLEIGLGNGYTTELLSNIFDHVIAVDYSKNVINCIKEKLKERKNIIYIKSSIYDITLDRKIHNFYMSHLLEHLDYPVRALKNIRKLLVTESGRGYISVPNSKSIHRQLGVLMGMLESVETFSENDKDFGHKRIYNLKKFRSQLHKSGFNILKIGGTFFKVLTFEHMNSAFDLSVIKALIDIADDYPEISGDIYAIVNI